MVKATTRGGSHGVYGAEVDIQIISVCPNSSHIDVRRMCRLDRHLHSVSTRSQFCTCYLSLLVRIHNGHLTSIYPIHPYQGCLPLILGTNMQVSGIPPLEYQMNKQLRGNKEYEEYKRTTPILFPKLFS